MDSLNGCMSLLQSFFVAAFVVIAAWFAVPPLGFSAAVPTVMPTTPIAVPSLELVFTPRESTAALASVQASTEILKQRLNLLSETAQISSTFTVALTPDGRSIVVQVAPLSLNSEDLITALTRVGFFEIVDFSAVSAAAAVNYIGQSIATTAGLERDSNSRKNDGTPVFTTIVSSKEVASARPISRQANWGVEINLTPEGAALLGQFSGANQRTTVASVLDGEVLSTPKLFGRIETPIVLNGNFTEDEVKTLAAQIAGPPLPIALVLSSIGVVTPSK